MIKSKSMKIKTKFSIKSWDGLKGKIFTPKETELVLSKGDKVGGKELGGFQGSGFVITMPKIEIVDVTEKGIDIIADGLAEPKKIDMMKPIYGARYSILLGNTLVLATQTMDTGIEVSINPVEIIR